MKKLFLISFLMLAVCSVFARGKNEKDSVLYVMGASISFSDTVVYFTEIQELDGVLLEKGLMPNRQLYSYELKDYMSAKENMPGRISVIFYSEKRKELEKKEKNVKKRLETKENMTVRYLGGKFKFTKH